MSAGNFASLTAGLLARKGEAKPSPVMAPENFPFAQRVARAPVDAPIPAGPSLQTQRRELPFPSDVADVPAKLRRMFLQLSAMEYEALGLLAVKKGTTPQHLLRQALHDCIAEFVEQSNGSCHCIRFNRDQPGK